MEHGIGSGPSVPGCQARTGRRSDGAQVQRC